MEHHREPRLLLLLLDSHRMEFSMDYTRSLSRLYEGGLKDNRYLKDRYGLPQNLTAASLSGGGLAEAEAVTVTGGSSCKSSRRRGSRPSKKLKVGAASKCIQPCTSSHSCSAYEFTSNEGPQQARLLPVF